MIQSLKPKKIEIKTLPILPTIVGYDYLQEQVNRPKGLPACQFFLCKKGRGELNVNGRKFVVNEGQSMLLLPNEGHSYRGISGDWYVDILALTGNCLRDILRGVRLFESAVYDLENPDLFEEYVKQISQERNPKELSKIVYQFLIDYSSMISMDRTSGKVHENEIIQNVVFFLEENYDREITLDEVAREVGLTKEYLCSVFKKEVGQTIIHFLTSLRISHARQFLVEYPQMRIVEIARRCGFESASYFGKVFRESVGISPDRYRNQL